MPADVSFGVCHVRHGWIGAEKKRSEAPEERRTNPETGPQRLVGIQPRNLQPLLPSCRCRAGFSEGHPAGTPPSFQGQSSRIPANRFVPLEDRPQRSRVLQQRMARVDCFMKIQHEIRRRFPLRMDAIPLAQAPGEGLNRSLK